MNINYMNLNGDRVGGSSVGLVGHDKLIEFWIELVKLVKVVKAVEQLGTQGGEVESSIGRETIRCEHEEAEGKCDRIGDG